MCVSRSSHPTGWWEDHPRPPLSALTGWLRVAPLEVKEAEHPWLSGHPCPKAIVRGPPLVPNSAMFGSVLVILSWPWKVPASTGPESEAVAGVDTAPTTSAEATAMPSANRAAVLRPIVDPPRVVGRREVTTAFPPKAPAQKGY